jgi:sec-independent protein translocase protein TatB
MFDIGWSEMLLIIVVMIIVIGPKDLPKALYTLGQWVGKVRAVARQFQDSIEQMAHQSGVDEVRKEIESVGSVNLGDSIEKTIDPKGEIKEAFDIKAPSLAADDGRERTLPAPQSQDKSGADTGAKS